jgi:hypothetical protein
MCGTLVAQINRVYRGLPVLDSFLLSEEARFNLSDYAKSKQRTVECWEAAHGAELLCVHRTLPCGAVSPRRCMAPDFFRRARNGVKKFSVGRKWKGLLLLTRWGDGPHWEHNCFTVRAVWSARCWDWPLATAISGLIPPHFFLCSFLKGRFCSNNPRNLEFFVNFLVALHVKPFILFLPFIHLVFNVHYRVACFLLYINYEYLSWNRGWCHLNW